MSDKSLARAALRAEAGDLWPELFNVEHATLTINGQSVPLARLHLVHSKTVQWDGHGLYARLVCTCGSAVHVGLDGALSVSQRHEHAYRQRMGIAAALHTCICCWPLEVEPTSTGHSEACPAHGMLGGTMVQLRPGQCCARDVAGVGSCDMHSAPGALRSVSERDRALKGSE